MTTTATIKKARIQADNVTTTVYEFAHVESGQVWLSGVYRLGPQEAGDPNPGAPWTQTMLQAFGDGLAADAEAQQVLIERERAWAIGRDGGDPDLHTWHFNSLANIRKYFYRRLFNEQVHQFAHDPTGINVCSTVAPYLNKHNNSAINGFIDAGWGVNDVGNAKSKISAVGVNVPQLDHGLGELSLADF